MANRPITDFAQNILKPYINNQDKAYAANIAPVETSPATSAHTAGTQIIYNGVLYDVTADIAANDALATTGAGANIAAADDVSEQISNVKQALSNEVVTRSTLGAHNINGTKYLSTINAVGTGVNFVVNNDGSITVSNNASSVAQILYEKFTADITAQCVLSGGYSDNVHIYIWDFTYGNNPYTDSTKTTRQTAPATASSVSFYMEAGHEYAAICRVLSGTQIPSPVTLYPMIRLASDADTTYQPYAKNNVELTQENTGLTANAFANGAVNLLPSGASSNYVNGVTFTANNDGTVSASGTATGASATINYVPNTPLKAGRYKLTGNPTNGYNISYVQVMFSDGTSAADTGTGDIFTLTSDVTITKVVLAVGKDKTAVGAFKPMITLADVPNSDYNHYVPYAKSNKELTDTITSKAGTLSATSLVATNAFEIRQFGKVVAVNGYLTLDGNQTADGVTTNDLGTVSGVDLPNVNRNVHALCGIAANPWEKPTEVTYITLTSAGNLQLKLSTSGAQSVYFSFSYVVA